VVGKTRQRQSLKNNGKKNAKRKTFSSKYVLQDRNILFIPRRKGESRRRGGETERLERQTKRIESTAPSSYRPGSVGKNPFLDALQSEREGGDGEKKGLASHTKKLRRKERHNPGKKPWVEHERRSYFKKVSDPDPEGLGGPQRSIKVGRKKRKCHPKAYLGVFGGFRWREGLSPLTSQGRGNGRVAGKNSFGRRREKVKGGKSASCASTTRRLRMGR